MENPSSGMLWFLALLLSLDKLSQCLSVCEAQRGGCDVSRGSKACFGCIFFLILASHADFSEMVVAPCLCCRLDILKIDGA